MRKLLKPIISIGNKDDLFMERVKFMKAASEEYGYKNVWSFDGPIYL